VRTRICAYAGRQSHRREGGTTRIGVTSPSTRSNPGSHESAVQDDRARGRSATHPLEVPARGWKDILFRVWKNIGKDRVIVVAAGVANAGMKSLFDALNLVYNEPEKRSFVWLNIISLSFTVLTIVFALVAIGAMVVVPVVLNFLGLWRRDRVHIQDRTLARSVDRSHLGARIPLSLRAEPRKAAMALAHLGQRRRSGFLVGRLATIFLVCRELW
jgi:hypothetical protein